MKETFSSEIAQYYTVNNDVTPVFGHTTVRTSHKMIGLVLSINCWCRPSNPLPVIPVRDTGIQPLIANKQVYGFDKHKNSRFHAKDNIHYEKTGFQCRRTGMTPFLHSKLQRSYSCALDTLDDTLHIPKSQCMYSYIWDNIWSFR